MFNMLESSSERILRILAIILESEDTITIKDLAKKLSVSEKCVYNDLKYIESKFNNRLEINYLKPYGIEVIGLSTDTFLTIQSEMLLESNQIRFILLLFNYPGKDFNYYADKLHTSLSTMYRYYPKVKNTLAKYNLSLQNKKGKYSIISENEYDFRKFFTTLNNDIYLYDLDKIISNEWQKFLYTRLQKILITEDNISTHYVIFYYISLKREINNNTLPYQEMFIGKDTIFTEEEQLFLNEHKVQISINKLLNIESLILLHQHTNYRLTGTNLTAETNKLITNITNSIDFGFNNTDKENAQNHLINLCLNAKYFKFSYYFFYDRFSFFSKKIEENHNNTYNKIIYSIQILEKNLELDLSNYYNQLVFLIVVNFPHILQFKFQEKILVVSNYSELHSSFLWKKITQKISMDMGYFHEVLFIQKDDLRHQNLDDFLLIISNSQLPLKTNRYIKIGNNPCLSDIDYIQNKLCS